MRITSMKRCPAPVRPLYSKYLACETERARLWADYMKVHTMDKAPSRARQAKMARDLRVLQAKQDKIDAQIERRLKAAGWRATALRQSRFFASYL